MSSEPPNISALGQSFPDGPKVNLRLLNVTDLHMEIRAYDYFADTPTDHGGLAQAATLIEDLRREAENSLTFDNGDFLQGTPMGDLMAEEWEPNRPVTHPMIDALNTLGLDAATVGNHEFNYGLSFLTSVLAHATFPVVCANIATRSGPSPEQDETLFPPFVILDRTVRDTSMKTHDLKVGVIGLTPPQIIHWDRKHLEGRVVTRDIIATAKALIPAIRAAGADIIEALSHSGIEDVEDRPGLENASLPLAATDGFDAIITGHSHLVFPSGVFDGVPNIEPATGLIHGKPATMAGFGGSHVGVIDLTLAGGPGNWTVAKAKAEARPVGHQRERESATERAILAATESAHQRTLNYIRRPVGRTDRPLDSYLTVIQPSDAVLFVAAAQAWYVQRALAETEYADLPLLSAAAPFKAGGRGGPERYTHVAAGSVAIRNVADLYGYPNLVRAVAVTGNDLRLWLEHAAGHLRQVTVGHHDQPLQNPAMPSYNFDTITGITYEIDLSQPARFAPSGHLAAPDAWRILNLRHNGVPVTPDMRFVVATNDYRASRSGSFSGADTGETVLSPPDTTRDVLVRFLQETDATRDLGAPPWQLRHLPDTSVRFQTGPGVLATPGRLEALGIEALSLNDRGFLDCRAWLWGRGQRPLQFKAELSS